MGLTERQLTALRFPCARGPEVMERRFWADFWAKGRRVSTMLTINK